MSQQTKDLTKNVQILLKRKSQQFMLARILTRPELLPFLEGDKTIRVFTPQKQMFLAALRIDHGSNSIFRLEPRGVIPPGIESGTILLLVFAGDKENYIVQSVVDNFSFLSIAIKSLDPRINARRLSLLPATFFMVSDDFFKKISNEEILVKRVINNQNNDEAGDRQSCRDVFVNLSEGGDNVIDGAAITGSLENGFSGILTDISSGGCCIQLKKSSNPSMEDTVQFGIVKFDVPVGGGRSGSVAVLIRQFRHDKLNVILHCMFLEPLPNGFLAV